jgi:hypothetical protein
VLMFGRMLQRAEMIGVRTVHLSVIARPTPSQSR